MYASVHDMINRYGETEMIQLSDRANTGLVDVVVVEAKLADASAEIDAYLQGRYDLPIVDVPVLLTRIAADIARYHLYDDRATEQVTQRYKDAVRFLESVARGTVHLGLGATAQPALITGGPEVATPGRVFTRHSLREF